MLTPLNHNNTKKTVGPISTNHLYADSFHKPRPAKLGTALKIAKQMSFQNAISSLTMRNQCDITQMCMLHHVIIVFEKDCISINIGWYNILNGSKYKMLTT